jgi:hypothetical protein
MLVWFVGASLAAVWFVFRDPHFAFGWVVAGVLLPDVVEGIAGRVGPLHSVVTIVVLMGVVMLATIGKRGRRKKWLALTIGMFLHLVFDGVFAETEVFWWPLGGIDVGESTIPSFERSWQINVALEVVGAALVLWFLRQLAVARGSREIPAPPTC